MKDALKDMLKVSFWIIAWILFPIVTGLYFIWPANIFKNKMSKEQRTFWWVLYAVFASVFVVIKICICIFIFFAIACMATGSDYDGSVITESVLPAPYRTSEDFHKLTGVEFPELEIVDSLFYDDNCFPTSYYWNEYKFVAKRGKTKGFYKRLKRACKTDSTHWKRSEEGIYNYWIYPDSTPVDRSRGMCDRMVEDPIDGEKIVDWDGSFISVEVHNDTIVLREGWVR